MNKAKQGFLLEVKQTLKVFALSSFCLYSISNRYFLTDDLTGFCKEWCLFKKITKLQAVFPSEVYLRVKLLLYLSRSLHTKCALGEKGQPCLPCVSLPSCMLEGKGKRYWSPFFFRHSHFIFVRLELQSCPPPGLLLLLLHSSPSCTWLDKRGSKYLSKGCERWLICNHALPVARWCKSWL